MEGDRLVVSGASAGSHFPRKQTAMQQRFEANGTGSSGPFLIEGSVYGRDVRFRGPGVVCGPVLGRGDVTLDASEGKGPQRFLGGLHASGNVVVTPRRGGFAGSLIASVDRAAVVVRGDVVAEQVSLTDAVVFGNVRARRVKLSRCIVFGQVVARETAVISSSTLLAYEASEVRFEGPCCMVFAAGTSVQEPAFGPAVDEQGIELPYVMGFLPALRALGSKALMFRPAPPPGSSWAPASWVPSAHELGPERLMGATLRPVDWVRTDVVTPVRKVRDGKVVEEIVPAERCVLSIAGRALDFGAISSGLEHATWMLRSSLEFDHYSPAVKHKTHAAWEARCTRDERVLLHWATSHEPLPASLAAHEAPTAAPAKAPAPAPSPAAVEAKFEVTTDGDSVVGPVTIDQIRRGVEAGKLAVTMLARRVGSEAWTKIEALPEFVRGVAKAEA